MKTVSILFAAAFLAFSTGHAREAEKAPPIKHLGRFLAMDGACGWPILTVSPNGEITALVWPYPNHGFNEGAAECWISSDGGARWQRAGVPVTNVPGVARLNVAAGLNGKGAYAALVGGFGGKPSVANVASYKFPKVTPNPEAPVPAISQDQGRTWQRHPAPVMQQADGQNVIPYGRIEPLGNGELGVMCYSFDELVFYTSRDDGISWQKRGLVTKGKVHNETTWLRLANGDLYAAARTWDDGHVDGLRSTDGGVTWRSEGALTLPRQHPADLTRLPDGRILLTYCHRNQGMWGIWVRFGDAEGRSWTDPVMLVDMEDATDASEGILKKDGGYPSTVVLPSGVFVTAYYTKGTSVHRRYHIGVVRWTLDTAPVQGRSAGN